MKCEQLVGVVEHVNFILIVRIDFVGLFYYLLVISFLIVWSINPYFKYIKLNIN